MYSVGRLFDQSEAVREAWIQRLLALTRDADFVLLHLQLINCTGNGDESPQRPWRLPSRLPPRRPRRRAAHRASGRFGVGLGYSIGVGQRQRMQARMHASAQARRHAGARTGT